jgi:cyclic pyranopterin phosphate synthase
VDLAKVRAWLAQRAALVEQRSMHHRSVYHLENGATVELVDPVGNAEFCANCHRVRVTHDGGLKGCLNRLDDVVPTRGLDDEGVRAAFRRVVAEREPYYGVHDRKLGGAIAGVLPADDPQHLYATLRRPAVRRG